MKQATKSDSKESTYVSPALDHADELKRYRHQVMAAFQQNSTQVLRNGSPEHAAILIEHIFKTSSQEVGILSHELLDAGYGNCAVLEEAESFFERGGQVTILVEKLADVMSNDAPNKFVQLLKRYNKIGADNQVSFYSVPEDVVSEYEYNFVFGDDTRYRFEPDRQVFAAIASANNKEFTSDIKTVFASIKDRSNLTYLN